MHSAVMSLIQVYPSRNVTADTWRAAHLFNVVAAPAQMLNPAQSEKVCDLKKDDFVLSAKKCLLGNALVSVNPSSV